MAKKVRPCGHCGGTGKVLLDEQPCEAILTTPQGEKITCWAVRPHDGHKHAALLCDPCSHCGGFDEHLQEECYEIVSPISSPSHWYEWDELPYRPILIMEEVKAQEWQEAFMAPVV